jgi:alkanesulfonate monooxygenase SsuD/methylene tetrahydromethanopterin reductase-like flavin-dependent oxidoreductase (luciferase family)
VKKIGFLSFGHWSPSVHSQTRSAGDFLRQSIDLAVAAEELGVDGAYFRVHHFAQQAGSPFPLLSAIGARTHVQQRKQIEAYRAAYKEAGHEREPRVSVSRSIFALTSDTDRAYFGRDRNSRDQVGMIDDTTRAIFGRSYAAEPDELVKLLQEDEAIQAADTVLLTIPNQLGVDYNAHVLESILTHVAPDLGWR